MVISGLVFIEWQIFETKVVEKVKTQILRSLTFFSENRFFYEIMWKNMVEPADHMWQYGACTFHAE